MFIFWSRVTQQQGAYGIFTFAFRSSGTVTPPPGPVIEPPFPHRLSHDLIPTLLHFLGDDGFTMSTPLIFTAGETGTITLLCEGADGTVEDLSTATAVTLRVVNVNGTAVVNAVALTSLTNAGTGIWTRTAPQVATAGDYRAQVMVTRSDATIGYFPDAVQGMPITILATV